MFHFRIFAGFVVAGALSVACLAEEPPRPRPLPPQAGALCGDPALIGAPEPAIVAEGGCGVAAPVRLASVAGVALEPPALVSCATAQALAVWMRAGPSRVFAAAGERLEAVTVLDAYSCRNRNRAETGKLSEHALGNAIDIGGFLLEGGGVVTVRDGWGSETRGPALRAIHDAGCGPFGTVLGPEANALHADHLHFDVAVRRSGPYCE